MREYDYIIADVRLRCSHDLVALGLNGFKPFAVDADASSPCTTITLHNSAAPNIDGVVIERSHLSETNSESTLLRTIDGYAYTIERSDIGGYKASFYINTNNSHIDCYIAVRDSIDRAILRFGLWVMFGIVIAPLRGIAIHSSAIAYRDHAALFLGESGTGKSTHTRLWREYIEGAHLLNDDSPIVRIIDGTPYVYGSPWSGKTPCYINKRLPIAGIVRLSQAPHNKICRVNRLMAIGILLPSCPYTFAKDERLQDEICTTLGEVIAQTPIYTLECLPNKAAAELSCTTLYTL